MAKGYLRAKHTDVDGTEYDINDAIEIPRETEAEKVTYDHLVAAGVIGRQPLSNVDNAGAQDADKAAESGRSKSTRTSTTSR